MKTLTFIALMFLTACSSSPQLTLRPQPPPPSADKLRFPDIVRPYYFGRYVDPNDTLVMHDKHVVYRVEENARWDLHPNQSDSGQFIPPRDAAFSPTPANDAILAEVNAQKLASARIMAQAETLTSALAQLQAALQQARTNFQEVAALRASIVEIKRQLSTLETRPTQPPVFPTNDPSDSFEPRR
jgi:hypothetical protein